MRQAMTPGLRCDRRFCHARNVQMAPETGLLPGKPTPTPQRSGV
jgi:hypothetical protein